MTDLGTTIDVTPAGTGGEPTFQALVRFIRRFTSLFNAVVIDLMGIPELDETVRDALTGLVQPGTVRQYAEQIIDALDEPDPAIRDMLVRHGLADNSTDMTLKMATFDAAVRQSHYREAEPGAFAPMSEQAGSGEVEVLDAVASVGTAFTVANAVLKSVSHAIPVAGAYGEVKESVEAGIDLVGRAVRGVRGAIRRLRRRRR